MRADVSVIRQNDVTIDLDAIRNNYLILRHLIPEKTALMSVVKANAYGHGMLETAKALSEIGAAHFAVALPEEGIELRLGGISGEILVLGAAMPRALSAAISYELTQTVFYPEMLKLIEQEAEKQHRCALVHIKLDTGMNRIGIKTDDEAKAFAQALRACPHVRATGIYTHFADADSLDDGMLNEFSKTQLARFIHQRAFFDPTIPIHAANSAATLLERNAYFNMVREGISLYGYPPVPTSLPFQPALRWRSEVVYVKEVAAGETIGYGRTFAADRNMRIATVAVGYGDGYHRALSNRGKMLIHGKAVPIVGRVCMDQTMVDVSSIDRVSAGDEVVLLGSQGNAKIDAEDLAAWAGTISYEVLLAITSRVPRFYEHV